jgi:2-phospho-L-lactate guanylyltransferase
MLAAMVPSIVVPHRGLPAAKTRLSGVLDPEERLALAGRFLRHVLGAIAEADVGRLVVISPDASLAEIVEAAGGRLIVQHGLGLNAGLEEARRTLAADGATVLVVLHGDLPELEADDVRALLAAVPRRGVAIAPDARGTGTNGMAQRPIDAIPFRFGRGSFAAHRAEAAKRSLQATIVRRPGISFDVDTPADLQRWLARGGRLPADAA